MKIVEFTVPRKSMMDKAFSRERLYETRSNSDGALQKLLSWMRRGDVLAFERDGWVRLGREGDNFVILCYCLGIRYKLMKDGTALVSSADPEEDFAKEREEFEKIVDTILIKETDLAVRTALSNTDISCKTTKFLDLDGDGTCRKSHMGIVR